VPDYNYENRRPTQGASNQNRTARPQGTTQNARPRPVPQSASTAGAQPRRTTTGTTQSAQPRRTTQNAAPYRSVQSASGTRPYRSVPNTSSRATQGTTAGSYPRTGAPRPAQQSRPSGYAASGTGAPRPRSGGQSASRPAGTQNRIYQNGSQNRRPASAPVRPKPRPAQQGGYGYSGPKKRPEIQLSPWVKPLCGVLCVLMLVVMSVSIAAHVRANQPQPTISMGGNESDPLQNAQTMLNAQQTSVPTQVPANVPTNVSESEPTMRPADPTAQPVQPSGSGRSVTIRAIGDVIIDTDTLALCKTGKDTYDFSNLFSMAKDVMSDADWTMINIEATLRKHKEYGYMGYPQFRTPPSILDVLKDCGVDMLTMCNNHALDGYFDGLKDSINFAEAAGLAHVGAYRTQEEFDTPEVYDLNGIKVGMLNYTQYTNGMASLSDKNATIYGMRLMENANYARDIKNLKDAGAEYVVAIMHWGAEYIRYPEADTEKVAKKLIAAGADLIIGGHPHVVQPAEYITATDANGVNRTGLVIYSIGNFLSEHRHENVAYTDNGVIFEFTLQENDYGQIELVNPACIPVYVWQIDLGGGKHDYRVLPSGQYLNSAPAGMSASQYERMKQSWNEIVDLMNGVVPVIAQ